MNPIGLIIIFLGITYFFLTVVFRASWLNGHWIGTGITVSRIGDVAWSIAICSWSLPLLIEGENEHVSPIALLGVLLGFILVLAAGSYDQYRAKKARSNKGIQTDAGGSSRRGCPR